jgi:hypothetical protein
MPEALAAAQAYLERGWRPIPVPRGSKGPILNGWQHLRLTAEELPKHFDDGQNVGILNGEPSGDLVDIDLDRVEAVRLGAEILPTTGCIFGRDGKARSHYLYRASGVKTRPYRDLDGSTLVELRSSGSQTIVPPSVADGKLRAWDRDGEPANVDPDELLARTSRLAAACILARHWPGQGARHDASLALAGGLLRAGWSEDDVAAFVLAVARAAGDEEVRDRVKSIATTARRLDGGATASGWPKLAELIGEAVVRKARDWLGVSGVSGVSVVPEAGASEARTIRVDKRFLREITREALEALEAANRPPRLFQRGGVLVQTVRNPDSGALEARALRHAGLKGLLDRAADFVRLKPQKDGTLSLEPARPPDDVVQDILALTAPPMPALREVVSTPIVLPDSRILRTPGYDPESGFFLDLRGLEGVHDAQPLGEAVRLLRDELFADFPFADRASLAHAVGMLVQPFVRPLIVGPTPMYMAEAPLPGSGKGLLVELQSVVADGAAPAVMAISRDQDEQDKRITALLLQGARTILLDNVSEIASDRIAAALTATTWRGRLLGHSQMLVLPNTSLWACTGNNIVLSKEMARRVVPIRLDAGLEHPEDRTGFRHRLPSWAFEHRAELVTACLSIAKAWLEAGRPAAAVPFGTYESWVAVVGGIVQLAGFPDFLTNRRKRADAADAESAEWAALCAAWWERWRARPIGATDLLDLATERKLLLSLYAERSRLSALQRMGRALASKRDAVVAGWAIRDAGPDSRTNNATYRLEPHDGGRGTEQTTETTETTADQEGEPSVISPLFGGETTGNNGETTDAPEGADQIGREADPVVSVVSVVSEPPDPDPCELVAADVAFAANAAGLRLDADEVAARLLAERPELAELGNVERLGVIASIVRRRDG